MFVLRQYIMVVVGSRGFVHFADTQRARRQVFKVELRSTDYTSLVKKTKNKKTLPFSFQFLQSGAKEQKGKRGKEMRVGM